MTNKKSIIYLAIAILAAILLCVYLFGLAPSSSDQQEPASIERTPGGLPQTSQGAVPPSPAESQAPEPAALESSEEKPILGQFMRVREIHDGAGRLRNLEFVFREGILPQMLFPDNRQVIVKYDQLARNVVGFGAATAFFYYEFVTHDTNSDGTFDEKDALTVAVSRPTGWEYRVLVRNVDEVLAYEDLPEEDALRLSLRAGGKEMTRVYPLTERR